MQTLSSFSKKETKGLIFDLDGTLFDANRAYAAALIKVGIDPKGDPFHSARDVIKKRLSPTDTSSHNRLLYFKVFLEATNSYSPFETLKLMQEYENALREEVTKQWQLLNRQKRFMELVGRYPIVILTNENTRTQLLKLECIDPDAKLFPNVITSEEIGVEKPSAKMFDAAVGRLGLKGSNCIMIGDSLELDIFPAIALGMKSIWNTEFLSETVDQSTCPGSVAKISKLDEFFDWIES